MDYDFNEIDALLDQELGTLDEPDYDPSDDNELENPEDRFEFMHDRLNSLNDELEEAHDRAENMDECATMCEGAIEEVYHELTTVYPFYEAGVLAAGAKVIATELTKLGSKAGVKLVGVGAQKALSKGVGSYVLTRFKKYTTIYPEIDSIDKFSSEKYDLMEATSRFNVGFKLASKWAEKISTRVECKVYSKNNKPAFAIAYGKVSSDKMYNTEFVLLDSKYSKHIDFYTASVHADVGIGHPSIERTLNKIKSEWKKLKDHSDTMVTEAVEDSFANSAYERARAKVIAACEAGVCSYEAAESYLESMELAGYDTEDSQLFDW